MKELELEKLEKVIGYSFKDKKLLEKLSVWLVHMVYKHNNIL